MKNILKNNLLILGVVILIASVLRLYQLGNVPPSPNWDEVSLGYNAYSILQTGRDEFGDFLPVILRSFDDYKPALYSYFAIPSVALFGLTAFAVRLPSALFGIATIPVLYFLILTLFQNREISLLGRKITPQTLGLVAALFLAISPWHIQFSRIAFEANVGLALNLIAVLLFLKGIKRPVLLVLSFAVAGLNLHMYQSEKVFTPLMMLFLSLVYYKEILKLKKWYALSVLAAFLVALPLAVYLLTNENALLRARGVSVFSDSTNVLKISADKLIYDRESGNVLGLLLDNRRVEFFKQVVNGYIAHFDLNWLFISGDIARHHAPNMGLLYLFEFPFLLFGIYLFTFSKLDKKIKLLVFGYLLIVPIPASITSGVPHAVRTINFLGILQILTAFGTIGIVLRIIQMRFLFKSAVIAIIGLVIMLNISYYLNQYFVQQNYVTSREWLYGYEEAIEYIEPRIGEYDEIIVTNKPPLDQSYMFFLFYLRYPPSQYLEEGGTQSGGFREENQFGKFRFVNGFDFDEEKKGRTVYIGRPGDFGSSFTILKTVEYLDGQTAIVIAE